MRRPATDSTVNSRPPCVTWLPTAGTRTQLAVDKAAEGIDPSLWQLGIHELVQIVQVDPPIKEVFVVAYIFIVGLLESYSSWISPRSPQQVLDRYQPAMPPYSSIGDGQMYTALLQVGEGRPLAWFPDEVGLAHHRL